MADEVKATAPVVPPVAPVAPATPAAPVTPAAPTTIVTAPPETPAAPVVPAVKTKPVEKPKQEADWKLKLPEGSLLDASALEKTAAFAKAQGLSEKQAQALLEREHADATASQTAQEKALEERRGAWIAEAQADKEVGGVNFAKNAELAKRVVQRFGDDVLKEALNVSGLGNHVALVRMLSKIGAAMEDDKFIKPGSANGTPKPKSAADILFPLEVIEASQKEAVESV